MQTSDNKLYNRGGGKSLRSNWKEYVFGDEFDIRSTSSGIDKNKLSGNTGDTPYITRTDTNNGIDTFIGEQADRYKVDDGNVITIGLDTQTVFYQPKPFYTGQNIQVIRHKQLDRYNAMFIIVAIKKLVEKFSWGSYGATLTRLKKSRLYLPSNDKGEIDFAFMSSFMQDVERDILGTTLKHFKDRLNVNKSKTGGVKWQVFNICDVFDVATGANVKSSLLSAGSLPRITAKDTVNGIALFTSDKPSGKLRFNEKCVSVSFLGSVFYQPYKSSFDMKIHSLTIKGRKMNAYVGLFIATECKKQFCKYAYGNQLSSTDLPKQKILLPIDSEGKPDWDYMESHMRRIESQQILQYLETLNR